MSEEKQVFLDDTDSKGIRAKCTYSGGYYTLEVSYGDTKYEHKWFHTHPPIFGMDVCDADEMMTKAEELATLIEQECGI